MLRCGAAEQTIVASTVGWLSIATAKSAIRPINNQPHEFIVNSGPLAGTPRAWVLVISDSRRRDIP